MVSDAFALPRCQELPTRYSPDGENCVGFKEFLDGKCLINLPNVWDYSDFRVTKCQENPTYLQI